MRAYQPSKATQMPTLAGKDPGEAPRVPIPLPLPHTLRTLEEPATLSLCLSSEIKEQKAAMERELQASLGPPCTSSKHRYTKT